jgi:hypothetical protein
VSVDTTVRVTLLHTKHSDEAPKTTTGNKYMKCERLTGIRARPVQTQNSHLCISWVCSRSRSSWARPGFSTRACIRLVSCSRLQADRKFFCVCKTCGAQQICRGMQKPQAVSRSCILCEHHVRASCSNGASRLQGKGREPKRSQKLKSSCTATCEQHNKWHPRCTA